MFRDFFVNNDQTQKVIKSLFRSVMANFKNLKLIQTIKRCVNDIQNWSRLINAEISYCLYHSGQFFINVPNLAHASLAQVFSCQHMSVHVEMNPHKLDCSSRNPAWSWRRRGRTTRTWREPFPEVSLNNTEDYTGPNMLIWSWPNLAR